MGDAKVKPAGRRAGGWAGRRLILPLLPLVPLLPLSAQDLPPLPNSPHVLALARAPDSSLWIGTYGDGIWVMDRGVAEWRHIAPDTTGTSISWGFVHAFAFENDGTIWYGTVGNGWGKSDDGGKTWTNWTFSQLGPEYQYVVPNGIVLRGDTVYVGTADGVKVTCDGGASWRVITDSMGVRSAKDPVLGRIENQYVLAIAAEPDGALRLSHLKGVERSTDGGRTWWFTPVPGTRVRAVLPRAPDAAAGLRLSPPSVPSAAAPAEPPRPPLHTWFARPVPDQPYIDQTYRYGSTMGGNFQQHQGVEFNGGEGTPVYAIGDGEVVFAGAGEAGANTVAIRHDRRLTVNDTAYSLFSAYYHHTALAVRQGQRVKAGDLIGWIGNTGRATNDHLHLEVHAMPVDSAALVVDPDVRYPPYSTNPELWIAPLPGTGIVAGQVWSAAGEPVPQARVYGLVKPEPAETPFSFAETYGARARGAPAYREHFAVGDVPPGEYVLWVEIEGRRVSRRVRVEAGKLSWVEFRP